MLSHSQWVVCLDGGRSLFEASAGIHGFREVALNQPACLCRAVENLASSPCAPHPVGGGK